MLNNLLAFIWWDCMPLFAVISPIVVDFVLYKIRNHRQQDEESGSPRPRPIFLVCQLVLVVSSVLIFFATCLVLDYKISLALCAMFIGLMIAVLVLYKKTFKLSLHRKPKTRTGAIALPCSALVFLILNGYLLLALGVALADVTVILMAISLPIAVIIFCRRKIRAQDHETPELKGGLFILICLAIAGLIVTFPLTNFCIGAAAGGWQYRWMERFRGASQESFVAVFGQPARDHGLFLSYDKTPWFSYALQITICLSL